MPLFVLGLALMTLTLLTYGCDKVERWRDSQVRTSSELARGSEVTPPAQAVEVPDSVREDLPLREEWTILSYSEADGVHSVEALVESDPAAVSQDLHGRLAELGYATADNFSRILEGATYFGPGDFKSVFVRVTLNTSEQTLVTLRAAE